MEAPTPDWLTYRQVRTNVQRVRAAEVPVEHYVSLAIPTVRGNIAGFAHFAAPAIRRPEGPVQLGSPDRWWVSDARRGQLMIYALTSVQHFATDVTFAPVELDAESQTMDELRQLHSNLNAVVDRLLPNFFRGQTGDVVVREEARTILAKAIPVQLMPIYLALAPDFFTWLATAT